MLFWITIGYCIVTIAAGLFFQLKESKHEKMSITSRLIAALLYPILIPMIIAMITYASIKDRKIKKK
ncbi:MAG: hypothetical protein COU07_01580 [Candidatus Harrisonbacteria bacterium CG10_big_fil_rev_8_21_14_0_10_40_38]|uniref:Uncharacterized protein n=1 Tax=Candidatus Harrisonbacteria bacterium CG10_big_fil_rev_8_21_14_0_10_40_38 TaxID=1974583 RepID=A0A2H0UT27_9BACT|nr:MAG: hypothetical protein COU07_01580 [Candidatus Harrisonbacteria bacterium CG10_big_fil_rev_8_21_14_0_10_40_38]